MLLCFLFGPPRTCPSHQCLDALVIDLDQADSDRWCTSALNFRLCRSVSRLHLAVNYGTPLKVWKGVPARGTRGLALGTRELTRRRPEWEMTERSSALPAKGGAPRPRDFTKVRWPTSYQRHRFSDVHNQSINGISWRASLQMLTFGMCFNQRVNWFAWPGSVWQLTFGWEFNQPIRGVTWSALLQHFIFGNAFKQPIQNIAWPS